MTPDRYCQGCEADIVGRGPEACTCPDGPKLSQTADAPTSESDTSNTSDTDTAKVDLLDGVRNGTWLSRTTFPPLRWPVTGLLPEGFTLLVAPPKTGKSLLIADLALSVAAGGHALGALKIPVARPVLNLALEDGDRRMKSRCEAIYGTHKPLPENYYYVTKVPAAQVLPTVRAFVERYPDTAMVILDTLGRVMPPAMPGESSYSRDYRIGTSLWQVAADHPGLAMVVIHHDRKATSDDFVDSVSGTNGLAGSADTIMVLSRKRKSPDGLLKVTGRDVPEEEYALKLDGVNWTLDGADLDEAAKKAVQREEAMHVSDLSNQIISHVREQQKHKPDGVRAKDVTDKFGPNARTYLSRHTEAGRLTKSKRGLYLVPD